MTNKDKNFNLIPLINFRVLKIINLLQFNEKKKYEKI